MAIKDQTSSTTKTTTMTTPAKLYGKDLSEYDEVDVDALLAQLSPEEINILAKEVDPDDNFLPPNQRCSYECKKSPTGPLDRKKLIEHINKEALETPDLPEIEPFVKGTVRGKKWVPPPRDERELQADEQIAIDMGEEYEHALSDATQEEIIDLAAILGFHSMMNQDQYHASLLNKGQPIGMGWDGITKSTQPKLFPMDPPNTTDIEESIKRVKEDDSKLIELNLNNIKNISDEKYEQLFAALPENEHLEVLSLTNVGLTDKTALLLAEAIEKSKTLRVLNVETNFISPPVIVTLVKSLLKARTIEEFRASNQRSTVLGNKIEMEITDLVEKNTSLLRLGLHLEFNDARHRVAAHLQRNIDRNEHELKKANSLSPIPKRSQITRGNDSLSMQKAKSPKPIHLELTPSQQHKIESKSELIESLKNQKQNDRARGEISLPVPQNRGSSKSPVKEIPKPKEIVKEQKPALLEKSPLRDIKSPVKEKTPLPSTEEGRKVAKEVAPIPSEIKTEHQIPSKESKSPVQEIREPSRPAEENKPAAENVKPVASEPKPEQISSLKETKSPVKEIKEPLVEEKKSDIEVNAQEEPPQVFKTVEPVKVVEKKSVEITVSQDVTPVLEETKAEVKTSKESKFPVRDTISPVKKARSPLKEIFKIPRTPFHSLDEPQPTNEQSVVEIPEKKCSPTRNPKIGELRDSPIRRAVDLESEHVEVATDLLAASVEIKEPEKPVARDRLSESVSPSRHLEDRMTLLRAKIDNFAEVADEKMANLRSRIEDISREPLPVVTEDAPKPLKTRRVAQVVPPIETAIQEPTETLPTTLPPKPSKTLLIQKTPNSVGITLVYQNQIFERQSVNIELPKEEALKEPASEQVVKAPLVVKEDEAIVSKRIETKVVVEKPVIESAPIVEKPLPKMSAPEEKAPLLEKPEDKKSASQTIEKVEEKPLEVLTPALKQNDSSISPNPKKSPVKEVPATETALEKLLIEEKVVVDAPKVDTKALALSLLTIKKGETVSIDPTKTNEVTTQSLPKPSPLLRLSVKKGDPQKIDPAKTIDASTQSIPRANPLTRLSIKKCEMIAIDPITTSEVSTQFTFETPQAEAASQTMEDESIKALDDSTQTPLVFSSLEHDYIFPGLRRVPYLPRPKTINIGGGDKVVVKPSSKPINEVLMLLYPVMHDYSKQKDSKTFGLEQDIIQPPEPENTIKDLEDVLKKATQDSEPILNAPPKVCEEEKVVEVPEVIDDKVEEVPSASVRSEIEIPLTDEVRPPSVASEARFQTKYTAVEKVSAMSRTTIESEEQIQYVDKSYKSIAEVSTSDRNQSTRTSIKSANMWESLSGNLIRATEKTLFDLSKATEMGEIGPPSNRTRVGKIGKVSVYSSIEDLSSRSRIHDRHLGTLIKTVETTSVYSSLEDIPYTKYSDRYKNGKAAVSTASVYSSTEDLPMYLDSKYSHESVKQKPLIYSSMEDLPDHYSPSHYKIKLPEKSEKPREMLSLLPKSKFSDRYKSDQDKAIEAYPMPHEFSPAATDYYKSAAAVVHSGSKIHYKSAEELLQRSKIADHGSHESLKYENSSMQTSIQSSISRNKTAMRPYTYVPSSAHSHLSIDHVVPKPTTPSTHTSTLQLNISPSGISELPLTSGLSRYTHREPSIDKPSIKISRVKDDPRSYRKISPKPLLSKNLLQPYPHQVSDLADDDDSIQESPQSTVLDSQEIEAPKKRINIMDTIKMLKNRVRDVITTEDRFTETHRLPTSSYETSSPPPSSTPRRGSRSFGIRSKNGKKY